MSDLLALFRTFVRTVEAGSFSAVARELSSSQPTVSRQIAVLEEHLGCLLFQRTTRALTLTDDGRTLYEHARRTLEAAAEAESAVGRRKGKPSGTLRLACAGVFGRLHVIPRLPRFRARFPDVQLALHMGDGFIDLVEEGVDLAIRVGETTDGALIAKRIGASRRVVVATPSYLAGRGLPGHPSDLAHHDCVVYDRLLTGAVWTFSENGAAIRVPVTGPIHVNNTEGVRAAVLEGLGIGYVPAWHFVEGEIESGRLTVLLRDFEPPPHPIDAVYASRRYLPPKVRAAIDFFGAEFDLDPRLRIGEI
jgi:DNA-binding transcriptional LysR family regulator